MATATARDRAVSPAPLLSVPARRCSKENGGEGDEYEVCMCCGTQQGRAARLLKCLHSACDECLQQLVGSQQPGRGASGELIALRDRRPSVEVKCFLCQTVTRITTPGSRYGAECLVKNQQLSRKWIVNRLEAAKNTYGLGGGETGWAGLQSSVPVVCEECDVEEGEERDDDVAVTVVCLDCSRHLCRDHANVHRKTRSTAKHSLHDVGGQDDTYAAVLAEQKLVATACPNHSRDMCKFFCKPCNEGFCERCLGANHNVEAVWGSSLTHIVYDLEEDFVVSVEQDVWRTVAAVEERDSQLSQHLQLLDTEDKAINKHAEDLSEGITSTFAAKRLAILAELDQQEQGMLQKVDKVRWADLSCLSKAKLPLQQEQSMLQHATSLAESFKQISGQADRASACLFWTSSVLSALPQSRSPNLRSQRVSFNSRASVDWGPLAAGSDANLPLLGTVSVADGVMPVVKTQAATMPIPWTRGSPCAEPDGAPKLRSRRSTSSLVVQSASSLSPKLSCQRGKSFDGLKGYISAAYEVDVAWTGSPDASVSISRDVSRQTARGGLHAVSSEAVRIERRSSTNSAREVDKIVLDFSLPVFAGTYELSAPQLSFSKQLSLPRCLFSFHGSLLHNARQYADGRGVEVAVDHLGAGAALGPKVSTWSPVSEPGNVMELPVLYVDEGGQWRSAFGLVGGEHSNVNTSVGWRRDHTCVLFNEMGEIFYRPDLKSTVQHRKAFRNGVPAPQWDRGGLLKLRLKTTRTVRRDGLRMFEVSLLYDSSGRGKSPASGMITVFADGDTLRPYFWFSPDSYFQLVPPF